MSDFKVIETQEEFDKVIQKRLERNTRETEERFKDYASPDDVAALKAEYDAKIKDLAEKAKANDSIVNDLTQRATSAETALMKTRVANENGIPLELAGRLIGNNEEEVKKDAEAFASFLMPKSAPPLRTNEISDATNTKEAAYANMLTALDQTFNK